MDSKVYKITGFADEIDSDFEKQIKVLHECNISFMELRSAYGKNISEYTLEEARQLKKILDRESIRVSAIGSPIGKIGITEDFEAHFQLFCHVVALAKLFQTKYIRLFSFYIPKGEKAENYKEMVFDRMNRMISYARKENVVLLHENEKGIYGDIADRCRELMERFYGDHFKQIFDFANFVQCGQEVFVAFEILKPYIAYIHIKDASMDTHQVVPAGMGDGHLAEILGQLKAENYDGFYSMEPHLAEFAGLRSLEREGEKSILGDELTDGELGFVTAYQAFLKIIER